MYQTKVYFVIFFGLILKEALKNLEKMTEESVLLLVKMSFENLQLSTILILFVELIKLLKMAMSFSLGVNS